MEKTETICAVSTAKGGAIGIVRVSGSSSIALCDKVFRPQKGVKHLSDYPDRRAIYGLVVSPEDDDEIIDEVIIIWYRGPHS